MKGYFYILECNDNSYYYGSTKNLEKRLLDHYRRRVRTTRNKLPIRLVYQEEFLSFRKANIREHEVKSWKDRKRVETLVNKMPPSSRG